MVMGCSVLVLAHLRAAYVLNPLLPELAPESEPRHHDAACIPSVESGMIMALLLLSLSYTVVEQDPAHFPTTQPFQIAIEQPQHMVSIKIMQIPLHEIFLQMPDKFAYCDKTFRK